MQCPTSSRVDTACRQRRAKPRSCWQSGPATSNAGNGDRVVRRRRPSTETLLSTMVGSPQDATSAVPPCLKLFAAPLRRKLSGGGVCSQRIGPLWLFVRATPIRSLLKHLLLQVALSTSKPERPGALDHIPAGYQGTAAKRLDAVYAPRVRAALRRALMAGDKLTTEEFLGRAGAYAVYKHRKDELPALRSAVREFRSSAASVKPLGGNKSLFRKVASA